MCKISKAAGTAISSIATAVGESAAAPSLVLDSGKSAVESGGSMRVEGPIVCVGPFCIKGPTATITNKTE